MGKLIEEPLLSRLRAHRASGPYDNLCFEAASRIELLETELAMLETEAAENDTTIKKLCRLVDVVVENQTKDGKEIERLRGVIASYQNREPTLG
jgi:hypothetical protein